MTYTPMGYIVVMIQGYIEKEKNEEEVTHMDAGDQMTSDKKGGSKSSEDILMDEELTACPACRGIHDKKKRSPEEFQCLNNRLKRIEGQIRGIERMLEDDAYCPDILIQVSAVNSALNSFSKELLASHIRSCVVKDIREGNDEVIEELVRLTQKLMK